MEGIPLDEGCPHQTVQLGQEIEAIAIYYLVSLLQEYQDIFAFSPTEMPGIDLGVMEHQLNVDVAQKPMIQKKWHMGPERVAAATAEVQNLLEASFIRECQYPEWISNIVLVKKPNGTWRIVNFTNLNKACPKDNYP